VMGTELTERGSHQLAPHNGPRLSENLIHALNAIALALAMVLFGALTSHALVVGGGLHVNYPDDGTIVLRWEALYDSSSSSLEPVSGYRIYRRDPSAGNAERQVYYTSRHASTGQTPLPFAWSDLAVTPGIPYVYRLQEEYGARTPVSTFQVSAILTPRNTSTASVTPWPTSEPTLTLTPTPSDIPTATRQYTLTPSPSPVPTSTPQRPVGTPTPTLSPTASPYPVAAVAAPTGQIARLPLPGANISASPLNSPLRVAVTLEPTVSPTSTITPTPIGTATPSPTPEPAVFGAVPAAADIRPRRTPEGSTPSGDSGNRTSLVFGAVAIGLLAATGGVAAFLYRNRHKPKPSSQQGGE
jgi:hypothetical protein